MIKSALLYIPRKIKKLTSYSQNKKAFEQDYASYLETGKTTEEAYQRLIQLYCASNGKFNEEIHQSRLVLDHPIEQKQTRIINKETERAAAELAEEGYTILDTKIPAEVCDELVEYASNIPCTVHGFKDTFVYNAEKPIGELYRLKALDIMNSEAVQKIIMDPQLIEIARNYLGCEPIFDFPAMWWSTSFSKEASAEGAQLYHFDMDRIKWLKVFFYLTDVNDDNGPHCYIATSHKIDNKPQHLLDRGYVRIPDTDLKPAYPASYFKEIKADKGTIFFGDTKCWHKGKPLVKGDRLVLELQYTSSLFGTNYKVSCSKPTAEFRDFMNKNKVYASNIVLTDDTKKDL